jgi:hypothetical protein
MTDMTDETNYCAAWPMLREEWRRDCLGRLLAVPVIS